MKTGEDPWLMDESQLFHHQSKYATDSTTH